MVLHFMGNLIGILIINRILIVQDFGNPRVILSNFLLNFDFLPFFEFIRN